MAGLVTTFGAGAMTNSIGEIRDVDFLFVIGSNTSEAHPVIAMEMKQAVRRGAKLAVAAVATTVATTGPCPGQAAAATAVSGGRRPAR